MLELKSCTSSAGKVQLVYNVNHNVDTLRTVLEQPLQLNVDLATGNVTGQLTLEGLEVSSIDAAREKLAEWCDRMAAALRNSARTSGDLPLFSRQMFEVGNQPVWVQQSFDQLVQMYATAKSDADYEAIKGFLTDNPLKLIPDLIATAKHQAALLTEEQPVHPV